MALLAVDNITKKFNDQIILDRVSFTVKVTDRIALVGKNGIGKTTLLEILAGKQSPDSGSVTLAKSCLINYVEQEKNEFLDFSLFEFVADARRDLLDLRRRISEVEEHLVHSPQDKTMLDKLGELQHTFETDGGFDFENEISIILEGLGFERSRYDERLRNFSGGEKNRAGLARILAGKGNLLLLDEPTNHLDIESTTWLEDYLTKLNKAYIVVSHDRAFMNATVNQVWELVMGSLETYVGGFEFYITERQERRRLAEHHYKHQRQEIERIEDFIRRNMAGQKTKQAQSKLKYLNRIKRLPPPKTDSSGPAIRMESSGRSWAQVLNVDSVWLAYGDRTVLEDIDFDMYRGDKVGIIGRNGSGKTTLLKALIGELEPVEGRVALGNKVDVAYFDQELSDLDETGTVLDNVWQLDPTAQAGEIRSFLARFGFTGEDVLKRVSALSGGEKTKLSLARLLYHPANLVIFDEPTNHLDIYAREALESALRDYEGCCLVVSHDRYFLDRVADRIVYLNGGRASVFEGTYSEFKEKMMAAPAPVKTKNTAAQRSYETFKEQSRRRARHKKEIESTRARIAELDSELAQLEVDLTQHIPKDDWEKLQEVQARKDEVETLTLELYAKLEELEKTKTD
jgi:ATP-binding cassette subfamily F protein 3